MRVYLCRVPSDRILIVEDDDAIAYSLTRALDAQGWLIERAASGADALKKYSIADLVILDLGLPDMDGLEVCRRIRLTDSTLPILMLTARADEIDVVVGLEAGAVDYIAKPFRLAELLARIRVQLRSTSANAARGLVTVGELVIDEPARRVWQTGIEIELRVKEFDLLVMLVRAVGTVVSREAIMSHVWDEHWFGSTKTLDVHIASLRRKLGEQPGEATRITALRAVGYRFEKP